MTKKTKKEKIIAQYRRKMKLLSQMVNRQEDLLIKQKDLITEKKDGPKKSTNFSNINQIEKKKEIFDYNLMNFFKEDFKKSSLISFFIIALEFLIYFAILKNKIY